VGETADRCAEEEIVTTHLNIQAFMEVFGLILLVVCTFVGAGLVTGGALLIRRFVLQASRMHAVHFVTSHSLIILTLMALGWEGFLIPPGFYDDVCWPYLFVPGFHLYWIGGQIAQTFSPSLFKMFSSHEASMIGIVIIPGLTGLILGGLQWYILGYLFQKFSKHLRLAGQP
jgi:hypothetical protein